MSGFDIPGKIIVDADIPDLAPVLDLPLPDVDAFDESQEGGAVKSLQLCVLPNQLHLLLDIIRLLLLTVLGLVLVHQLDAHSFRDAPQHLGPHRWPGAVWRVPQAASQRLSE